MGIADSGFGTIYKGAQGTIAGSTLIFMPSAEGEAVGNVYDNWDDLYAARAAITGRVVIEFDDRYDDCVIPNGEYDMSDTIFKGAIRVGSNEQIYVEISEETAFYGFPELYDIDMRLYNWDPLFYMEDEEYRIVLHNSSIGEEEGGGLVELTNAYLEIILLDGCDLYDDDGFLFYVDGDSYLYVVAYQNSELEGWTVEGDGFCQIDADSSSYINTDQDCDYDINKIDQLDRIDFGYNGGDWSGVPSDPNDALTRIAAKVAVLNGDPIP